MPDRLKELTSELISELEIVFARGRETPHFRHALCAYVTYWRRMGADADRVIAHTEALIDRVRDEVPEFTAGYDDEIDTLAADIIERCAWLATVEYR